MPARVHQLEQCFGIHGGLPIFSDRISQRGLAVGVVVAAHLGLLWLLVQIRLSPANRDSPYTVIHVLPIQLPPEVREVTPGTVARPSRPATRRIDTPRRPEPPVDSSAITLPPEVPAAVDWQREARAVARSRAEPPVEATRSLDARPRVLVLPPNRDAVPMPGDTNVRPDGSIGFWTTDGIYCESRELLMNHFETWARSIPPRCYKRERIRPKPSQEFDLP